MTAHSESPPKEAKAEEPLEKAIVFVIDDDSSMRRSLTNLFQSVGLDVVAFGSAQEMLQGRRPDAASCLVVDVRLPGLSGLDLQSEMIRLNLQVPMIFISGHGDIPMTVKAMKGGAVDFLSKPFRDQELLDAVVAATDRDRKRRELEKTVAKLRSSFETLTTREQAVLKLVTAGLMNKQIAAELGLAEITVKIYRGHVMKKTGARSLADLIRMAETLRVHANRPAPA